ncbi:MAG TPA: hypothetical protein VIR45_14070 [Kiloniellaceae bacterium]
MALFELTSNDLRFVAQRLPRDVRDLLKLHHGKLFLGGGFIRAVVAGETPNDIDLFGSDAEWLKNVASGLSAQRPGSRLHTTDNAVTLLTSDRMTVQFITRWTFDNAADLVASFDFTVCQAAIWRNRLGEWKSLISNSFYIDLAGRRLVYTAPEREEEAGGSMLRVIKYVRRGYTIQVTSLGAVIARLAMAVKPEKLGDAEGRWGFVIAGLLREVDPALVVDGLEVVNDHEPEEGEG